MKFARHLLGGFLLLTLCLGCAVDDPKLRTYDNNDLELVAGNSAKMICTCVFVMEMDDAWCREWARQSPDVGRVTINRQAKTVDSSAFVAWPGRARFVDEKRGCVLE